MQPNSKSVRLHGLVIADRPGWARTGQLGSESSDKYQMATHELECPALASMLQCHPHSRSAASES